MTVTQERSPQSNLSARIPTPASKIAGDGATGGATTPSSSCLNKWLPVLVSVPLPVALVAYFIVNAILAAP